MKSVLLSIVALVCVTSVLCQSDCEYHRARELRMAKEFAGLLIPNCDKNGDYEPLQCHSDEYGNERACQCWTKNGQILKGPSFKLRSCSCIMAKIEAEQTREVRIPTCDLSGRFTRLQCEGDDCDCVNVDTGVTEDCQDPVIANVTMNHL